MQPEAQTTTRGSLAISGGALEIANVIQGALEVFWFTLPLPLDSGVPQGSVLGSLLFVLYVNEISCLVKSKITIFADDTKLWRKIMTEEDKKMLQEDMDKLNKWSEDWLLKFNVNKCKKMTIGTV